MGLFNRRAETQQELEALRAEIQMVRSRLDESEEEKRRLAEHLGQLGSAQERLTTQVGTVEQQVGDVEQQVGTVAGSIAPAIDNAIVQAASAADVELIQIELARMNGLASHVEQLRETVVAQQLAVASNGEAATAEQAAAAARLEELATALARQQEQIADVALVATDAAERTDTALDEMRAAAQTDGTPDRDTEAEMRSPTRPTRRKRSAPSTPASIRSASS